jgi:serine/threonine protein kinase
VAIKCLHPRLASNAEVRARFKNEAVTMSQLQHPNIVRLYDYIEEPDGVYLVMEYVEGDALDDYIQQKTGPIPEEQAVYLFGQILEGMTYAHQMGVIHRDIKPGNFMVTRDLRVKILDFGIAKLLESVGPQQTKSGARIGTVLYMSPEQVRGQALDLRSDIYSLGVTLFQMVTGQCPYPSQAAEYDVYQSILNQPLPRASSVYPAVSARMQALIDKATGKRPEDRFQNCRLFWEAVVNPNAVPIASPVAAPSNGKSVTSNPPVVNSKPAVGSGNSPAVPPRKKRMHWALKLLIWLFVLSLLGFLGTVGYVFKAEIGFRIGGIRERGPRDVAFEFLNAIEAGDSVSALSVASPSCKEQISLLFRYGGNDRKGRFVEILGEQTLNGKSEVSYRYGNEKLKHSLALTKRKGFWEAECVKIDFITPGGRLEDSRERRRRRVN